MVFHVSMVCIMQNPKIPDSYPTSGNIEHMPIFAENGSRSLKSQYLEITNSNGMSKNCPGNLKFGQVEVKSSLKLLYGYFQFCPFGHFSMVTLGMITFSWSNYSNYHILLKCIYLINLQKYSHLF